MDLASIDLNLLIVFDAMVEHRGVTRAGEAIGRSQPATSAAVSRLRSLFDDPLFIKSGNEMKLTPRAVELATPIRLVIDTVRLDILQRSSFDAAKATRTFSIVTHDIGEVVFVPRLISYFARKAPQVHLRTLAMSQKIAADALESGAADLAVGHFPSLKKAGFVQQKIFEETHACVVRSGHVFANKRITLKDYAAASHAVILADGHENAFDQILRKRRLMRSVVVEVSHFMSVMPLIESSDMVATVPRGLAEIFAHYGNLAIVECPVRVPGIEVHQFWHRRYHKDPANVWLRGLVYSLFGLATIAATAKSIRPARLESAT